MLSVKFGHCDKFYLFFDGSVQNTIWEEGEQEPVVQLNESDFGVALLDLSLENLFFLDDPTKRGALVNLEGLPANYPMNIGVSLVDIGTTTFSSTTFDHTQSISTHNIASVATALLNQPIQFSILDRGVNENKVLLSRKGTNSRLWELTAEGIISSNLGMTCLGASNNYYRLFESAAMFEENGILNIVSGGDGQFSGYHLVENGLDSECIVGLGGRPAVEVSPNNQFVYFVTAQGQVGYVPIGGFDDFSQTNLFVWSNYNMASYALGVRLQRNFFEGEPSLYIFHSQGVDVMKGINNPNTCTFHLNPLNLAALAIPLIEFHESYLNDSSSPALSTYSLFTFSEVYFQAPFQVYNYTSDLEQQSGACCLFNLEDEAVGNLTVNASAIWTASNNPFNDDVVHFNGDLVIPTGVSLTVDNLELRFRETSSVIIQPGGRLIARNSKLTSYICEGLMWEGIDLLGTTNVGNTIAQSINLNGPQGNCRLENSIVENALCAVEVGLGPNTGGGVLRANGSTFRNNAMDIDFKKFYFMNNAGVAQNMSLIRNCDFLTTSQLNDPDVLPQAHVRLQQVHKLRIRECDFVNSTDLATFNWPQRRVGLISSQASVEVRGNTQLSNTFDGLYVGVVSFAFFQTLAHLDCRFMKFNNCNAGILNWAVNNVVIVQNRFNIPEIEGDDGMASRERGIEIVGSTGYTLAENDFYGFDDSAIDEDFPNGLGIWVAESGPTDNLIERNDFNDLAHGIYTEGINAVSSTNGAPPGLQFFCNQFDACLMDIYVKDNARIRINQGGNQFLNGQTSTGFKNTSNVFSEAESLCNAQHHDILIDEEFTGNEEVFAIDYWCHSAEITKPNCSPDILSLYIYQQGFNYSNLCPESFTSIPLNPIASIHARVATSVNRMASLNSLLEDQQEHYNNLIDGKQTQQTIQYINTINSNESAFLRDILMERFPLSDQVLKNLLDNHDVVNPNHLAEVLIANSPLRRELLDALEEENILPPFLMYLVRNANGDNLIPSLRKSLELQMASTISEIELERQGAMKDVLFEYGSNDSLEITSDWKLLDSLDQSLLSFNRWVDSVGYIVQRSTNNLEIVLALNELYGDHEVGRLYDIGRRLLIGAESVTTILRMLSDEESIRTVTGAKAWLLYGGDSVMLNNPYVVPIDRQYKARSSSYQSSSSELKVWPNPAQDELFIHYPFDQMEGMSWRISNAMGQVVQVGNVTHGSMQRLEVGDFPSGVYIVELIWNNQSVMNTKFSKL